MTHCGCHVNPDLPWGRGDTPAPLDLLARDPHGPHGAMLTAQCDCGGVSSGPPPAGDQHRGPTGVSPSHQYTLAPSPTVSASPGSVQEKSRLKGAARCQAQASRHQDQL